MTSADQTARPDRQTTRRLVWPWRTRRKFRAKRPVRTPAAPADQTTEPTTPGPSIWSRLQARLPHRRLADQPPPQITAGGFAYLLLMTFGLVLLGVIAGAFLVGYWNVVDTLVRVVHVGDPKTVEVYNAAAEEWQRVVPRDVKIPALAYIGAGVIEAASGLTAIATVLLRAAPWRVRAYAWTMFAGMLSASVWAGIEHAAARGYAPAAGWFSGLWPLIVASSVHLFTVVRRWVFDPVAKARNEVKVAPTAATRPRKPRQEATSKAMAPAAPPPAELAPVRQINGGPDADTLRIIRAAHPRAKGLPSTTEIKAALVGAGQTCGQTRALRLQKLLKDGVDEDLDVEREAVS